MLNGLHLCSVFLTSGHSKHFTVSPHIHPFKHTFTHRRRSEPRKATVSSSGAVRVKCLAQEHIDTQTSNLPVTSQQPYTSWATLCRHNKCINNKIKSLHSRRDLWNKTRSQSMKASGIDTIQTQQSGLYCWMFILGWKWSSMVTFKVSKFNSTHDQGEDCSLRADVSDFMV
jgi:hypothetical protein